MEDVQYNMKQLFEETRELIHLVTQAIYFYKKQNYIKGNTYTMGLIRHGEKFFNYAGQMGFSESIELLFPVWKELLEALENCNETYLSDIYENKLIPLLFDIQYYIINELNNNPLVYWKDNIDILENTDYSLYKILCDAKENKEKEYILSWACTGDVVLSVETEKYGQVPLSSSVNPWQEAIIYGDELSSKYGRNCIVIGLGMGYHIKYILDSTSFKEIIILESDLEQIRICMMYTDMQAVLSDKRIKIVLCSKAEDYAKWLKESENNSTIYKIWYPSVKTVEDDTIRELLENYWVNISSSNNLVNVMLDNFENNQELNDEPADNLKDIFKNKDIVIIGAGPSLDNNLDYLRKFLNRTYVVIVCVGKAAKKLISENITPGYIVVIDAKKGTRWQTNGIENTGVPLIYLSTAAHNLVSEYNGKRYIAYQDGIEISKEYAEKNNLVAYKSGGSVATFIIDYLIHMNCKSVICIGLDMGYIGDNTHADGIGRKLQNKKSLRKVEAVNGGEIYTNKTLDIYRRWIERRIENVKDIKFINASGGARIHGMAEKSLKEITEDYCQQIIYCYVEEQGRELNKFVEGHNNESLIRIYYSVIEECEENIFYCLCDILNKYMQADKKLWFVTDIKNLYEIVKKLYPFIFEEIIYIEQENNKEFKGNLEIDSLITYLINMQKKDLYSSLIKRMYHLKESTTPADFFKFLLELATIGIEEDKKNVGLWCCICKTLLYELEKNVTDKEYLYYKLTLYSIIMRISKDVSYTNLYLSKIMECEKVNNENIYFVYQHIKRLSFIKQISMDEKSVDIMNNLYNKCYGKYLNDFKDYIVKIPHEERNRNLVMVMTVQFLDKTHAPTNTIMERIKVLKDLGKEVILINTTEFCLLNGYVPLYGFELANTKEKYNDISEIEIAGNLIPFLQLPDNLPIPYRMQVLINIINKIKPYYILSIGNGSMLAELCGNIVPCASMSIVFSTLPKTINKMKILGRKLGEEEKEFYKDDDIIESRFTFELKPQKNHYLRKDKNLPGNKFILVVVGTRLKFDVTDSFMNMLSRVCQAGCYVVFAGVMDNYKKLIQNYPFISDNSSFIGYCDDILALMEICDLYVNPDRLGGGFSVIEAFSKGKPGVYLDRGDVYTAGGEDFAVGSFDEMVKQILKYKDDKNYYNDMSVIARKRAELMTSSREAIFDIDQQICQRIEENYW